MRRSEHPDIRFIEDVLSLPLSALIVDVKHDLFREIDFLSLDKRGVAIFDAQGVVARELVSLRL